MRTKSDRTWTAALAALAVGAVLPAVMPAPAEAALVICQKGNKIKLRVDACKGKETVVDPADLGVQVPDGGVTATKLAPDATAAVGSILLAGSTTSLTPATIDRFTVDVPAAGVIHVTVAGQFYIDADATSASSLTTFGYFGLCDAADSDAECGDSYDPHYVQDADDAQSTNETRGFTLTRTITVAGAGPRTFYLNGQVTDAAEELRTYPGDGAVATVTFVPGGLNLTKPVL